MKKPLLLPVFLAIALFTPISLQSEGPSPIVPQEVVAAVSTPSPVPQSVPAVPIKIPTEPVTIASETNHPVQLIVPSIKLDIPIQKVGINDKGEMDVPSGKTNNAGWYQYGTVPGDTGSAVLSAHVFAAFSNLKDVSLGDNIYVVTGDGSTLHFVVSEKILSPLAEISGEVVFNRNDAKRLNLITCAGKFIPEKGTYDYRLIVYAILVGG